tara:strand:- start:6087 stop:7001 length:915 start_codon:yes stop_codon:yes gene_type:complete
MQDTIRIATRNSPLALAQCNKVIDILRDKTSDYKFKLIPTTTSGDTVSADTFKSSGGKGLFIKELENSLLNDKADMAVHSMKDVPAELDSRFDIMPVSERECPQDIMISKKYNNLYDLPENAKVGTSSPRRMALLRAISPHFEIIEIRGNIGTRLKKLEEEKCDALILAAAGLHRLNLTEKITEYIPQDSFVPSAGQGVLCIEFLKKNKGVKKIVSNLTNHELNVCVTQERDFVRTISGDCNSPIGIISEVDKDKFTLTGYVSDIKGCSFIKSKYECEMKDSVKAGKIFGKIFIQQGAKELLKS